MFRRPNIVVQHAPQHTEYVTREVHEHRAPTDDSVKLLREMEARAQAQIVEAVHVGDTVFESVIHTQKNFTDGSTTIRAVFSLNGKRMVADFTAHDWRVDPKTMAEGLRSAVADVISREILIPAFRRFEIPASRG